VMRSHVAMVTCIDISTQHLISCSTDGTIRIWDMVTMNQVCKDCVWHCLLCVFVFVLVIVYIP